MGRSLEERVGALQRTVVQVTEELAALQVPDPSVRDPRLLPEVRELLARAASSLIVVTAAGAFAAEAPDGGVDVVVCDRALNRTPDPLGLLERLRSLLRPAGTLVLCARVLDLPEQSEFVRLTPGGHGCDAEVWSIPGRLALHWMLHHAGLRITSEAAEEEGPRDRFPVVELRLLACPSSDERRES